MAATTDVTEMFKYTYFHPDRLTYIASQEIVLWNLIARRGDMTVGGRGQAILPFQTRNTGVFRGHAEGGALSTLRAQPLTKEATFSLQEFHGIYDVSWKALRQGMKNEWAFERMTEFLDQSMRRRVFRLLNAELNGTGRGELAVLDAAHDNTTIECTSLPFVDEGMIVDVMDATDDDTVLDDDATVTAIDTRQRIVTVDGAGPSGSAATDYLVAADSVSSAGGSLHMLGIQAWISESNPATVVGNIGGLSRATAGNEFMKANVFDNGALGNRPMTEDLMILGMDTVRERGGDPIDALMANLSIIRRYHETLRDETFASMGSVGPVGGGLGREESKMDQGQSSTGSTPYNFSGVPIHAEPYAAANKVWGISKRHWALAHDGNDVPAPVGEVFDVDMFKRTANATFEVDSYWEAELLCDQPAGQVVWEDIAEA